MDLMRPVRGDPTLVSMEVGLVLKVAGVGLLVSVATQILNKSGRDEQATLVTVAGIVVVLLMLVEQIGALFSLIYATFGF